MLSRIVLSIIAVLIVSASALAKHPKAPKQISEFDTAEIYVEQNATDGDTEIVIAATGGDDGFRTFSVRSPEGRVVVAAYSLDPTIGGQRELVFESPEPPGEAILAAYPEGIYRFKGQTHAGERFLATAQLSHELPPAAVILSPQGGTTIGAGPLLIQWSAVPDLAQVIVELENESVEPEQSMTFNLSKDATSFELPAALIAPGSSYQLGIGTVAENGNRVFVELEFETE